MERRHKPFARHTRSGVNTDAAEKANDENVAWELPHITELIEDGEIAVGIPKPAGCVAIANGGDSTLAMQSRGKVEALAQLLTCLDQAIALRAGALY